LSVLIILTCTVNLKLDRNNYSFAYLTLIMWLHYLVKCRSRSLAVYNDEFILGNGLLFETMYSTL